MLLNSCFTAGELAPTRGMMVLDQRVGTLQDAGVRRNVRVLEELDIELLKDSLIRAFSLDG